MSVRKKILEKISEPKTIYSRNEAKVKLKGLLGDNETIIIGLEQRDAYLKTYRSLWFLTEYKLVFISTSFPLETHRTVYPFDKISEMRLFEDEGVFVISTDVGDNSLKVSTETEIDFARQSIEQYNRYQEIIEQKT